MHRTGSGQYTAAIAPPVQVSPTVAGARIFISIVACIGRRHG
jgi:hypothetical protein